MVNAANARSDPIPVDQALDMENIPKPSVVLNQEPTVDDSKTSIAGLISLSVPVVEATPVYLRVKRNGHAVEGWSRKQLWIAKGSDSADFECESDLEPGENEFDLVAWTTTEIESVPVTTRVTSNVGSDGLQPRLIVLAIGVSDYLDEKLGDLSFAHRDASRLTEILKATRGGKPLFECSDA